MQSADLRPLDCSRMSWQFYQLSLWITFDAAHNSFPSRASRLIRSSIFSERPLRARTDVKIIFINRFFYPDISATSQMLSDQAFALARDGHEVTVIAAQQSYANASERLPASEVIDGVQIHRVWTSSFGRHRLRGRALDYASFFVTACAKLATIVRRGDIVVTKTDPPMLSVLTTPLCAVRGAKSVNWLQDIFPEAAERLGIGHGRAARACHAALRAVRNFSLRRADQNVVIGRVMRRQVRGPRRRSVSDHRNPQLGRRQRHSPSDEGRQRPAQGVGARQALRRRSLRQSRPRARLSPLPRGHGPRRERGLTASALDLSPRPQKRRPAPLSNRHPFGGSLSAAA